MRLNQRNILLFALLCVIGFYLVTLLRIESYVRQHQEDSKKLVYLLQKMEKYDEKNKKRETEAAITVKPVMIKKEILFQTQRTQPQKKTCQMHQHQYFPLCNEKIQYMNYMWKEPCFQNTHGVDGSECSILEYLTKVEPFCTSSFHKPPVTSDDYATPRFDLDGLLQLLPLPKFEWMRERAKSHWDAWVVAGRQFQETKQKWKKKRVIAFMGSMSFQPLIMELAGKGGPLGELVQWTDLISGLYILGYDVNVILNTTQLNYLDHDDSKGCAAKPGVPNVDVIYTDNNGMIIINQERGFASAAKYRCMYRVLDSFGTFVEFNYPNYPHDIPGGRSDWANHNLIPTQLLTLYPHTQDNSFLGFVVGNSINNSVPAYKKKQKALLYAKLSSYIDSPEIKDYLNIISEYFEIHATTVGNVPSYIKNHGSVSGAAVKQLLQESKLFIGVGFPFEGPGPMEAMAAGTVYLQPKFKVAKNKLNDKFFDSKPTMRKLTSQSPYMEEFVGEPYCYTIDVTDKILLRKTLEHIKTMEPLPPKIPREFTNGGMLERLHIFTEHMNFCNPSAPRWPPIENLQTFVSQIGQSCKDVCMERGLVCERTYFQDINKQEIIEKSSQVTCSSTKRTMHLHAPSYDIVSKICYLQDHGQLFSCMHEDNNFRQICPCRNYIKEQVSICQNCL